MKIALKTLNYGFHAEINNEALAEKISRIFPFESTLEINDGNISIPLDIDFPSDSEPININQRDVVWCSEKKCLYICIDFKSCSSAEGGLSYRDCIIVGKTLASINELHQLSSGEKISISAVEEPKIFILKPKSTSNRIMAQGEIDGLVAELLSSKE